MPKVRNVSVGALAGTGKSFTMEQAFRHTAGQERCSTGSEEQNAIWDAVGGYGPRTRAMMAFNKSVKEEWQAKAIPDLKVYTTFSFGLQVCNMNGLRVKDVNEFKTQMLLEELTGKPFEQLHGPSVINTCKMVNLIRSTLTDHTNPDSLTALADEFAIALTSQMLEWIPKLIDKHKSTTDVIDFADMVWLPVVKGLRMKYQFDFLGIDEAQDLTAAQQALMLVHGKRIMMVGDIRQAIYQFAGADAKSFRNMEEYLGRTPMGIMQLPLTVTRRCSKVVVRLANEIVPELRAMPDAPEGEELRYQYEGWHREEFPKLDCNSMIVCRRNAPLVMATLALIRQHKPARMIGRDFGRDVKDFLHNVSNGSTDSPMLISRIYEDMRRQEAVWKAKRYVLEKVRETYYDKSTTALVFCEMCANLAEIEEKMRLIFIDATGLNDKKYIRLASIHRAKGLEAERVHFLESDQCGVPYSKMVDGVEVFLEPSETDLNLRYVGITRAKHTIIMVSAQAKRPIRAKTREDFEIEDDEDWADR